MCDVRISNIEDVCSFNPYFKKQVLIPDDKHTKYVDMVNDLSKHTFTNKKHFMKVLYKIRKILKGLLNLFFNLLKRDMQGQNL